MTIAASDPLLAKAAQQAMSRCKSVTPIMQLSRHLDDCGIGPGERGELIAMLLVMQARDAAFNAAPDPHSESVRLEALVQALLPDHLKGALHDAKPSVHSSDVPPA